MNFHRSSDICCVDVDWTTSNCICDAHVHVMYGVNAHGSLVGGVDHCGTREAFVDGTFGVQRAGAFLFFVIR